MRIAVFDTHRYDRAALDAANAAHAHELAYYEARLSSQTAALARGFPAVCSFVNDQIDRAAIDTLAAGGVQLIALRSAGFNHVDLEAAFAAGVGWHVQPRDGAVAGVGAPAFGWAHGASIAVAGPGFG